MSMPDSNNNNNNHRRLPGLDHLSGGYNDFKLKKLLSSMEEEEQQQQTDSDGISSLTTSWGDENDADTIMDYAYTVITASTASSDAASAAVASTNRTATATANDDQDNDNDDDGVDERLEAGLRIFSRETPLLYQRVMLRAGYSAEEVHPSHPTYRNFAFHAWKRECQTVQGLFQQGGGSGNKSHLNVARNLDLEFPIWAEARAFLENVQEPTSSSEEDNDEDDDAFFRVVG